jgi:sigma-B regulation protein RsbU (phosphoserine phosphatase)
MKLDWKRAVLIVILMASLAYHGARAWLSLSAVLSLGAVFLEILLPLFFLGVGFLVAFRKPEDKAAWLLLFMMETFSTFSNTSGLRTGDLERLGPVAGAAAMVWFTFLSTSWPLAMFCFAIVFPEPLPQDTRRPGLKWLLILPLFAVSLIQAGANLAIAGWPAGAFFKTLLAQIGQTGLILRYTAISLFFAILGLKSGTATNLDSVRRLRILFIGAFLGLSPAMVLATLALITGTPFGASVPESVILFTVIVILVFPAALAYVVIVHKAMGVGMAIRQSLQYALAQRALRFIQMAIGIAVLFGLLEIFSDPEKRRVDRVQWLAYGVLLLVLVRRGGDRFRAWIDRRFFREAVDAERILADLGEHVRSIADRRDLLETVSRKIGEALHIPRVAAFVRGEGGFVPAFATGYGGEVVNPEFGNATVLTCCISALERPQTVYLDDKRSWIVREKIPETDAKKLRDLQSEVLIPLRTKSAVEGFLSLGPKSSEAAYSPSDLQLLQSVAHQTALALDNSRLVEQVANEVATRERITREIEIAREVQFTLLPQAPPKIPGLDLGGHCRPAKGIGGDYYDFIPLEGERAIGLAIGDIAGKGIPAALLMAGLQAALRGQALAGSRDLARVMGNINRLIYESSPANRYATFFYGEYRNGVFAYVNAGHNSPVLLRKEGGIERLETGGPVIGLMDFAPFVEGSIEIHSGDLLLGFTDGVSECMNRSDEEWDEARLIEVLRGTRHAKAADIVTKIMSEADLFADGAKQHDDMTLIVMKVLG